MLNQSALPYDSTDQVVKALIHGANRFANLSTDKLGPGQRQRLCAFAATLAPAVTRRTSVDRLPPIAELTIADKIGFWAAYRTFLGAKIATDSVFEQVGEVHHALTTGACEPTLASVS